MKTICVINNKGGVGKSASVITISHMLSALFHKRVLVVDLDPQGNTSYRFSKRDYAAIFRTILTGKKDPDAPLSVGDLLEDAQLDPRDAIIHTKYENLDILPSDLSLSETEKRMLMDVVHPQQPRLKNQLKKIQDDYDYCIIDCGPSVSLLNINGLTAADEAFIPLRVDGDSCLGVAIVLNLIRMVQEYNERLEVGGIFYTQYDNRKGVSGDSYELMHHQFSDMILPIKIGCSKYMEENSFYQTQLLEVDPNQKSPVTRAYVKLTEYIISPNRSKFLKDYEKELEELQKQQHDETDDTDKKIAGHKKGDN